MEFLVAIITILVHNLALAVFIGVIISALVFAWDNAKRIGARKSIDINGNKIYEIYGPLFLGSTTNFSENFDFQNDPDLIIIDFRESRIVDMSAIEVLKKIIQKYSEINKKVTLRFLSKDCIQLLKNANGFIEVDIEDDPT